ncbi:MAG TPA: methyltransferase domain-containing protein [Solirubrobacteraceae bacterium]|jgi:SAM-dependent methyltransferase
MNASPELAAGEDYILDAAWYAERERLDSITRLYDPSTLARCETLGATNGWRCLDVGAGTGSLARALSELVAPEGSVTALDVDTRFLEPLATEHLQVVASDATREPLPSGGFDLVHARLLLEHLTKRDAVLAAMVEATAPGGWVLAEDFDWSTALVIDPPSAVHDNVASAIMQLFAGHGYDASCGRTLPRRLQAAGLVDVGAHAESLQVRAHREQGLPQWELLADQLAPGLLAPGLLTQRDLDRFHELWHDGDTVCFAPLMVSCWGRRP